MELEGNSNAATSARLPAATAGATHRTTDGDFGQCTSPSWRVNADGDLTTSGLRLSLVNLPSYSPDFNADEAIWGWAREEVAADVCLGTKAAVQEKVGDFFTHLVNRRQQVKRRCRTVLQARAAELTGAAQADAPHPPNVFPTLASV